MGNVANGNGTAWLRLVLVPAITAMIVVAGMAARFGQRLDSLEQAAEARWTNLNTRLGAEDLLQRQDGLALERHDERISNLDNRGREIALQGQDFSRLIGELRAEISEAKERLARLEAQSYPMEPPARGR
jgi:chromosome segregation ATPase